LKYHRFEKEVKMPGNLAESIKSDYKTNGIDFNAEAGKHIGLSDSGFVER